MKRSEINPRTGEVIAITVLAYKNATDQVLLLDAGHPVPPGYVQISDQQAAALSQPKTPITEVSMRQARLALLQTGLLSQVQGAIDALESPAKEAAQIEWEYATGVERNSQLVQILSPALELTEQQLDDLFTLAATL